MNPELTARIMHHMIVLQAWLPVVNHLCKWSDNYWWRCRLHGRMASANGLQWASIFHFDMALTGIELIAVSYNGLCYGDDTD